MLAARNRRLRIAAALATAAWLILAAPDLIDVIHLFQETVPGGDDAAAVLFFASHLVGAFGWFMVAGAFGTEIDWGQLWTGATIVATTYLVYFVAFTCRLFAALAGTHSGDYRGYYIAGAIGALIFAAGASVAATGFDEARRGESRASRLQIGAGLVVAASVAVTIGELFLRSFYSATGAVHEATTGTLLVAVGTFLTGVAVLVFARGVRRPLAVRERAVVGGERRRCHRHCLPPRRRSPGRPCLLEARRLCLGGDRRLARRRRSPLPRRRSHRRRPRRPFGARRLSPRHRPPGVGGGRARARCR